MSKVEQIEQQIQALDPTELRQLLDWLVEFDANVWDQQLEADINAGKLDAFAEKALRDHAAGRTTEL